MFEADFDQFSYPETRVACAYISLLHSIAFLNGHHPDLERWKKTFNQVKALLRLAPCDDIPYFGDVVKQLVEYQLLSPEMIQSSLQDLEKGETQVVGFLELINLIKNTFLQYQVHNRIAIIITWPNSTQTLLIDNVHSVCHWRDSHTKTQPSFSDILEFCHFLSSLTAAPIIDKYDIRIMLGKLKCPKTLQSEHQHISKQIDEHDHVKDAYQLAKQLIEQNIVEIADIDPYLQTCDCGKCGNDEAMVVLVKSRLYYELYV